MMMKKMILSGVFFLLISTPAWAAQDRSIEAYNQAVDRIGSAIWSLKSKYPELANFSKSAVKTTADGFNEIDYSHQQPVSEEGDDPYEFRFYLRVRPLEQAESEFPPEFPEWDFARLGFKVVLEVYKDGPMSTFDPKLIVETNVEELHLLEQNDLPFRLKVKTEKESYTEKESITFTITLENKGAQPFRVMDLDEHSLFCRIDDMLWGSEVPEDTAEKILQPNSSIAKVLRVKGISTPKEATISCRYSVGFKGIQPFDRVKVLIKPAS